MIDLDQVGAGEPGRMSPAGGFTAPGRSMGEEDRIVLTSVGLDIGSSTSHLLFSRLELERQAARYVVTKREVLYESEILLTPYSADATIDGGALGTFVQRQYNEAGIDREAVDTGALILTGVALHRRNARAIADLFAQEAGRFVAVSAGDNLEATMAAYGSGAAALSETWGAVMNIDIGGGTTKVVICREGKSSELMAMDLGARLVVYDDSDTITGLEEAGREIGQRVGIDLAVGRRITPQERGAVVEYMVDQLFAEVSVGGATGESHLLRTNPLGDRSGIRAVTFSGGVSEFVYGRSERSFGDLGPLLAERIRASQTELGAAVLGAAAGIRATVIGASQYTIQVSGSTIFLSAVDVVPVRNVRVIVPEFPWDAGAFEADTVRDAVHDALARFDVQDADVPVAIAVKWSGSATLHRVTEFCAGVVAGMGTRLDHGNPLILVFDNDIGGLFGLHFRDEMQLQVPIISIDGIDLREFDFIDVGNLIPSSGAVPVVIKSLVFSRRVAERAG